MKNDRIAVEMDYQQNYIGESAVPNNIHHHPCTNVPSQETALPVDPTNTATDQANRAIKLAATTEVFEGTTSNPDTTARVSDR